MSIGWRCFVLLLVTYFNCVSCDDSLRDVYKLHSTTAPETQAREAWELIARALPKHAEQFQVTISSNIGLDDRDTFQVYKNSSSDVVNIVGSSGVAASRGFYHYISKYCGAHISWEGEQLHLPDPLPDVNVTLTSQQKFRYYQNVCTWSYSFTWWSWEQWRRHIDWMAISGINLALAPIQETLWVRVYRKLGLTESEINKHISGPAFLAWQRMGNINGWGGPIGENWLRRSHALQLQLIAAMRALGMVMALPAFAGHVPHAFIRLFPNASLTRVPRWNQFGDIYSSVYFLEPSDDLFLRVSVMFSKAMESEFGTDHVYFCDPFNEIVPKSGDHGYIQNLVRDIYAAMKYNDPNAIWLLQSWMFVHDGFWTDQRIKSFLTAAPIGKLLVLDLQAEQHPQYGRTQSFYGQPFIWCMLHNFGGTLGLFGSVEEVNNGITSAKRFPNSSLVGIGATPEGINQNYILYEMTYDLGWVDGKLDMDHWFDHYAMRRYGVRDSFVNNAWQTLRTSVYSYAGKEKMRGKYTYNRRPSLRIKPWSWYNASSVISAWNDFLHASGNVTESELFKHDLVDVTRQVLQQISGQLYISIINAYRQKSLDTLRVLSVEFLNLLDDLNRILSSNKDFLLGKWLKQAKSLAATNLDRELYEYNARNQITLWGPYGEIVDYANKQWSGVVSDFFKPRWEIFLSNLQNALLNNVTFDETENMKEIFQNAEKPFTVRKNIFPSHARGDTISISKELYKKWRPMETSLPALPRTNKKIKSSTRIKLLNMQEN